MVWISLRGWADENQDRNLLISYNVQKGATFSIESLDRVVHTKKKDSHNIENGFEVTAFDLTRLTNATDYVLHS